MIDNSSVFSLPVIELGLLGFIVILPLATNAILHGRVRVIVELI